MDLTLDQQVEATIMSLREQLMTYFKDINEPHMVRSNVILMEENRPSLQYQYQRLQAQRRQPCKVFIGDKVILRVSKQPDTALFYPNAFNTKRLNVVHDALTDFFKKYLPAVVVGEQNLTRVKRMTDKNLFKARLRDDEGTEYIPIDYARYIMSEDYATQTQDALQAHVAVAMDDLRRSMD
jgi:hypothetical protein